MNEQNISKQNYFTFQLDKGLFAVPVTSVKEVLHYSPVTPVPKSAPYLKGVINIRGTVVPVADFRILFGFSSDKIDEQTMLVITEIGGNDEQPLVLGLVADSVKEVRPLEIVPSDTIEYGSLPNRREFVYAVGKDNDDFVLILNMDNILSSIRSELAANQY
jgi:purine-binding chemotaxis protein CheW